jgi:hypothetical protein
VFPKWRGQRIAKRAMPLICEWLSADPIIRVEPKNAYSHGVPKAAGFTKVAEPQVMAVVCAQRHPRALMVSLAA